MPTHDDPIAVIGKVLILRGKSAITFDHRRPVRFNMLILNDSSLHYPATHPNLPVDTLELIDSLMTSAFFSSTDGNHTILIRNPHLDRVVILDDQGYTNTTEISNSIIRGVPNQPLLIANSVHDRRVIFDEKDDYDEHENQCATCQSYGDYMIITDQAVSAQGYLEINGQRIKHYFQQLIDQQGIFHYYTISAPETPMKILGAYDHRNYDVDADEPNYTYFTREVTEVGPQNSRKLADIFDEMIRNNGLINSMLVDEIQATVGHHIKDLIQQDFL